MPEPTNLPHQPYQPARPTYAPVQPGPVPIPASAPAARVPGWLWAVVALVAAVCFGAGTLTGFLLHHPAKAATTSPVKAATTFTAAGTLELTDTAFGNVSAGDSCRGSGGYDDIADGTQIVIYNAAGASLSVGALGAGVGTGDGSCDFAFTVADVPSGQGPYSVEVSHRGKIAFTQDAAATIALTLGD